MNIYLVKLGELTLKGSNIKEFERRLVQNTYAAIEGTASKINLRAGRMYVYCEDDASLKVENALNHLIGITGYSKANCILITLDTTQTLKQIKEKVMSLAIKAKEEGLKTFKIEARRTNKSFPLDSYHIACEAASDVHDKGVLKVDVHNPQLIISIEMREKCYIYANTIKGNRGLPVGVSGRGLLLLSGGIDSPVAGYRMLCRGLKLDCVYFHAHPYTSAQAQQKVETLSSILASYGVGTHLNIISFTPVQMQIKNIAPLEYTTLMLRIAMVKAASLLSKITGASCLVTGESLGQVASQTLQNMIVIQKATSLPILRPLVGMDKEDITCTAKEIGTYETSILPYEDCCVLFSPEHPILRAKVEEAMNIFSSLQLEKLIEDAVTTREIKYFPC